MLKAVRNSLLSLIYPQDCSVCGCCVEHFENGRSCSDCWSKTRIFSGSEMLCDKCGALLGHTAPISPVRCFQCDEYHFEKANAIGVYEKALAGEVIGLKTTPYISPRLRSLIISTIESRLSELSVDVVIPVPISKSRKVERGFNQAEVIAKELGNVLDIPIDRGSLARTSQTPIHRVGMDQRARELTVLKAFEVMRRNLIASRNVLLVDDVLTSGATSSACARALKKAGSGSVTVFTLARAVLH